MRETAVAAGGVSRRVVLAGAGVSLFAALLPCGASAQDSPPGAAAADGIRVLRARLGFAALRGEGKSPTPLWGYDGFVPGPLLRVRRGEALSVRLVNELAEPTAIHWHGVRLPSAMDGAPPLTQRPVAPNASFDYRFAPPDAGTFWYHAPYAAPGQVERGLYGALIVDEVEAIDVDRDVLLAFDTWRLDPGGMPDARRLPPTDSVGSSGPDEHVTVNGRPTLDLPVRSHERMRLRLLNAAGSRPMALRIERHRPIVVAIDGQPAEPFAARDARVVLGPGNRVDLILDAELPPGSTATLFLETPGGETPIARCAYANDGPARPAPRSTSPQLPPGSLPERMDFAHALRLDLPLEADARRGAMQAASGRQGRSNRSEADASRPIWTLWTAASDAPPGPPLFSVKWGRTVMLAFRNGTASPHTIHLHGHHFRLLDALDDGWKPFWLDTLLVLPRQTARVAFVADNPGRWLVESRRLEPVATALSAWFEVV